MSFQELCQNGSFLEKDFNGPVESLVLEPEFYTNQLNIVQRISLGILFLLLSGVAIIGNSVALFTIYKRRLQMLYKSCVISQCISDFLMAIFVGINSLNNFIQDTIDWKFGNFMCGWMPYVTTMCALMSSMILTCIAIDRYQGIVHLTDKWDPKFFTALSVVCCLWMIAAGTTIPTFLSYNLKPACFLNFAAKTSIFAHLCVTNKTISSHYFVTIFTFIFLPLLISFLVLYWVIARLMWSKRKMIKTQQVSQSASTLNTNLESHISQKTSQMTGISLNSKKSHSRKKVRTFAIILIIMGTFIICRLPQWIFLVVTAFPSHRLTGNFWWIFKHFLSALSLSNTAINPFIYSFLSEMMHLKTNLVSGLKNLKNLKLKNIRINLMSSSGK